MNGLTAAEVAARRERGQTNATSERTSRSVAKILRGNVVTRFNLILGTLLVIILIVGQPQDAVFGVILISNTVIGIAQELRAKITLDRLAVLNEPHVRVVRDGAVQHVDVADLVLDDLVDLRAGDQIVADGVVQESTGMQVDESLLTGESEPVDKPAGVNVLSGSFVVAGSGRYQATAVGDDAYARKLTIKAQRFELAHSELIAGINRILRYVTFAIGPVALLTVVSQLHAHSNLRDALISTVAALVGMVPQGLVLLTSIAFGVAAVSLARRKVLVQQLPAVEGLARVDVVCFDKTGTITDGDITFAQLVTLDATAPVPAALGALADDENRNATLAAVAGHFPPSATWTRSASVPFSSARKWSAATFDGQGTWVLGAPEIVLPAASASDVERAAELASSGARVLVLTRTDAALHGETLPAGQRPTAFVVCSEQVRPEAAAAIAYFKQQGVSPKLISGDSPNTVAAVAARVGVPGAEQPVDARHLPEDPDALAAVLHERSVFGRVTPDQKQAIVTALQRRGHTVAMTGDGVNDALALKLADVGIAMGSGAPATKAVAEIVLLDSNFATLPGVVAEGRRVTANVERVANIFLTKTVWTTLLAVAVGILLLPYPFLPRHLTIIDALAVGFPAFFLALGSNLRRYVPGFIDRVLRFTIPAGIICAATILVVYLLLHAQALPLLQQRTAATITGLVLSLLVLLLLALPFTWWKVLLVAASLTGFALVFVVQPVRRFYALQLPPPGQLAATLATAAAGVVALMAFWLLARRLGHAPVAVVRQAAGGYSTAATPPCASTRS
ncbi:MAG: HAD-IC family P-type ATPase [Candidatus Dormibacteraeota bacterium]|nr:HAD-IC family P-type ATPase [Candidatus Dormibacteraeota bacterium]